MPTAEAQVKALKTRKCGEEQTRTEHWVRSAKSRLPPHSLARLIIAVRSPGKPTNEEKKSWSNLAWFCQIDRSVPAALSITSENLESEFLPFNFLTNLASFCRNCRVTAWSARRHLTIKIVYLDCSPPDCSLVTKKVTVSHVIPAPLCNGRSIDRQGGLP
jgi:hypothetical protein